MKETPWSRIRRHNSVDKEFQEIVGKGKPTGGLLKETIAVSVTISIGRMREMRREPEVPEARVPVVECLDGPARITSKELAQLYSVTNGILQSACSTSQKKDADMENSALMRIARLTNSVAKGPKRMVTKVQWPR